MSDTKSEESCLSELRSKIRIVHDFPKKGIPFRDIFPLFQNPSSVKLLISQLTSNVRKFMSGKKIDVVVGLDARGFLFGPLLALELDASFVPVRKRGKLPGETVSVSYELEYRKDEIEMQKDSVKPGQTVLVVDDLLATGGTLEASCRLVHQLGANIAACMVVIELSYLGGRARVEKIAPVLALFQFDD